MVVGTVTHDEEHNTYKIGVKGLADSGVAFIPVAGEIPVVDLSGDRTVIVDQIREASRTLGFFQIVNHGVPSDLLDDLISTIKAFHEQPLESKSKYSNRDAGAGVSFTTNIDVFESKAATWRDTIQIKMAALDPERIPAICRKEVLEWERSVVRLGETLMGTLSEGLGLKTERLKEMSCLDGKACVGHYYPYCPEPDRMVGITPHTDPGVLTVLLQDQIGGLQMKHGEGWVDVKPVAGALVVNIGDILQILSNDEYKSVEHRVLGNPFQDPRISIAFFFNPGKREELYGPLPELISPEKPALYRQFTLSEFMRRVFYRELDGKSSINYFKL